MICFNRLSEGLFYYNICPLCNGGMSIINDGLKIEACNASNNYGFNLIFTLNRLDKVTINPVTEEIQTSIYSYNTEYLPVMSVDHSKYQDLISKSSYDREWFEVSSSCSKCDSFQFTISMQVNFPESKISNIHLYDESFCINDGDKIYTVTNFYQQRETILFDNEKVVLQIPLVPLTTSPHLLLNKLKKLIIFS